MIEERDKTEGRVEEAAPAAGAADGDGKAAAQGLQDDVKREMAEVKTIGDDTEWAPIPVGGPKTEHSPLDPEEGWRRLEARLRAGNIPMNMGRVRSAYEYAAKLHAQQKRRDGSPYVTHCIATA